MIVTFKPPVFKALADTLLSLGIVQREKGDPDNYTIKGKESSRHKYRGYSDDDFELDLTALTRKEVEKLAVALESLKVHGSRIILADLRKYLKAATEGVDKVRARTCRQAAWMLEHLFAALPHHTIFSTDDYGGKSHSGYYVGDVDWQPEQPGDRKHDKRPEKCWFTLHWVENDSTRSSRVTLLRGDCHELTALEILAGQGFVPETPKLMETLRAETERYYREVELIGKQYLAVGLGLKDLDDATKDEDRHGGYYYWGSRKIALDEFTGPTKVVVDLARESETTKKDYDNRDNLPDPYRWHKWNQRFFAPSEDELVRHLEADDDTAEPVDVDIPVHPLVPCFDLRRHVRLRVHVNNLTRYQYDKSVGERLILPERDWKMVNLLVDSAGAKFEDMVAGKGRSMNVLAAGPPGTGKTLTAEVFAEYKGRPLYSVQCSDLGLEADEVEKNLGIVMRRANRWKAVLLLDEADVYIRRRGADLQQNAIVGAFLRVLEYADCILFMTTNLGDEVDDAITSRCIAKLTYGPPGPELQARIWRVLAERNGLKFADAEIAKVTKAHPTLTGRDCKNLLKLASFIAAGKPLTLATITEALVFKPTETAK